MIQADFVLLVRDCFDTLRDKNRYQRWWPDTLLYAGDHRPFEVFSRAQSSSFFERLKVVFDIQRKEDFEPLFAAVQTKRLRMPSWDYHSISLAHLMGYPKMASLP